MGYFWLVCLLNQFYLGIALGFIYFRHFSTSCITQPLVPTAHKPPLLEVWHQTLHSPTQSQWQPQHSATVCPVEQTQHPGKSPPGNTAILLLQLRSCIPSLSRVRCPPAAGSMQSGPQAALPPVPDLTGTLNSHQKRLTWKGTAACCLIYCCNLSITCTPPELLPTTSLVILATELWISLSFFCSVCSNTEDSADAEGNHQRAC